MARRMGPRVKLKLHGVKEMQRALQELPDELQQPLVEVALVRAAAPMRDAAEELAPDAEPFGRGLVQHVITSTKLTETQAKEVGPPRKDEARVYVGIDGERPGYAPYAHLNEWGTGPRYHKSGKYVGEMPAKPFMRPAFDATARAVIRRFVEQLRPMIAAAAKRVAARNRAQ